MGFGNTSDENKNVYYVKIKGLKQEHEGAPWIGLEQKVGDDYKEVQKSTWINGWLSKAAVDSYEYKGKQTKTIELTLEDGDDKYILQSSYNQLSRSLINSLLSTNEYGDIKISVYLNKSKFKSIYVENNGQKMEWKYKIEELKPMTSDILEDNVKVGTSYKKLDAWLEEQFKTYVIPSCKPNPNPKKSEKKEKSEIEPENNFNDLGIGEPSKEQVPILSTIEKLKKAKELQKELDKQNKEKAAKLKESQDDLPF
jgi:hypothetical protein